MDVRYTTIIIVENVCLKTFRTNELYRLNIQRVKVGMPVGKKERHWFRPISELKGGDEGFSTATNVEIPAQSTISNDPPESIDNPAFPTYSDRALEYANNQTNDYANNQTNDYANNQTNDYANNQTNDYTNNQTNDYTNEPTLPTSIPEYATDDFYGGNVDFLSAIIGTLNTNPYFIGILMLLLNLGGRFLSLELTQKQEEFLQQRWLRPLIFFTVLFVATRNVAVAFWMTLGLFLILWVLANEMSPFCIIPKWRIVDDVSEKHQQYVQNMQVIEAIQAANR